MFLVLSSVKNVLQSNVRRRVGAACAAVALWARVSAIPDGLPPGNENEVLLSYATHINKGDCAQLPVRNSLIVLLRRCYVVDLIPDYDIMIS